eukprot:682598-Rhodomonas_salina.1
MQTQSLSDVLPFSEVDSLGQDPHSDPPGPSRYVPTSHSTHAPDPFVGLYLPALHAVHAAPSPP